MVNRCTVAERDGGKNTLGKGGTTMFWADRTNKVAGVTLLLLVALVIVNTVLVTAGVGGAGAADVGEKGGPGGTAAGAPVILQSARAVAAFAGMADPIGNTALGFGLLALGSLLAWARDGGGNPPR